MLRSGKAFLYLDLLLMGMLRGIMVTVEKAVIARLDRDGKHFEVLVDPEIAYDLKIGKSVSISKMLAINQVFTDSKKGLRSSASDLQHVFGSNDVEKIAEEIVKEGEIQLTTDFRRGKIEEKKRQIASLISKYAINPQTRLPHPPERIINAIEQSHVNVDPFKPAEQQIDGIIKIIKDILPISMEELSLTVEIPARYSGRVYGIIKEFGHFSDSWSGNNLIIRIKIPAGLKEKFYHVLGSLTEGNVRIEEKKEKEVKEKK